MNASQVKRGKAAKRKQTKPGKTTGKINGKTSGGLASLMSAHGDLMVCLLLVAVVFLCFANALRNEFVFDDIYLVSANNQIRSLDLPLLLSSYRPIRDISYAIDFKLWGENPFGFHLSSIVIHAANVLLVFALVRRLTEDLISATLTAFIFAVHPIQTDAVTYISGRRDVLFTLFYLLAFHTYLTYYRSRWSAKAIAAFLLFLLLWMLSLLSKEMAVSLPILIFVWHFCDSWEAEGSIGRRIWETLKRTINRDKWFWLFLSIAGVAFTAYWVLIKNASHRVKLGEFEYWGGSFYLNMLTVVRVHAWYLKQLVFPTPVAQYLGAFEISESVFDWRFLVSLVIVAGLLCYGFFQLNRNKLMAFAIFSYFVFLLPVSQLIPHHELLADHYLYLPIMSFGLFLSLLMKRIGNSGVVSYKALNFLAVVVVVIFAAMTIAQNRTWKDERTLWAYNYKAVPNSPRAALNLGNTYQYTDPKKAEELFKRALALKPTPAIERTLYDRLTVILINERKVDEAGFYVSEVLKTSPDDFFGNLWSSQINMLRKDCDKARASLLRAEGAAGKPREFQLLEKTRVQIQQQCGK
jgi:tetratricopeptide (TPR) repeat protein